jgi:hypothetical protein
MASKLAVAVLAAFSTLLCEGRVMGETHVLVPPVNPACISSPFGPWVLHDHPQAGTYHYGIDLPAPAAASGAFSPTQAASQGKSIRLKASASGMPSRSISRQNAAEDIMASHDRIALSDMPIARKPLRAHPLQPWCDRVARY